MSNQKDHELMGTLGKVYKAVLRSGAKGMRAVEIADKLGLDKSTVHPHLNSLQHMGLVESDHGVWCAKTGEQTIKPLEKEITIVLPAPRDEWQRDVLLEHMAKDLNMDSCRIALEKLKETRTIRIIGKNVDDLDLEKIGNLIQQANEKSLKASLSGLFKSLKRSRPKRAPLT